MKISILICFLSVFTVLSTNSWAYYNQDNSNYHKNFMEQKRMESEQRLRDLTNQHEYGRHQRYNNSNNNRNNRNNRYY